jgi:hypothetical protein
MLGSLCLPQLVTLCYISLGHYHIAPLTCKCKLLFLNINYQTSFKIQILYLWKILDYCGALWF